MCLQARATLLEQLQDPKFRSWLRENRAAFEADGLASARNRRSCADASYPLSAVFAFFVSTSGGDLSKDVRELETREILAQLVALGNRHAARAPSPPAVPNGFQRQDCRNSSEASSEGDLKMGGGDAAPSLLPAQDPSGAASLRRRRLLKKFQMKVGVGGSDCLWRSRGWESGSGFRI